MFGERNIYKFPKQCLHLGVLAFTLRTGWGGPARRSCCSFTGLMLFWCFFWNRSLTNGFLNTDLWEFLGGSFFATRLTKYWHVERAEIESDKDNQKTSRIFTTFGDSGRTPPQTPHRCPPRKRQGFSLLLSSQPQKCHYFLMNFNDFK